MSSKRYPEEFKIEAVKQVTEKGHSVAEFVTPQEQEIYSIDECFLDLTAYASNYDLTAYTHLILDRLSRWLGLPACIGIGRTKTEAKMANHIAKKNSYLKGVCNL